MCMRVYVDVCVVFWDRLCSTASRKSTRFMGTMPGDWLYSSSWVSMNFLSPFISCRSSYTWDSLRKSPDTQKWNNYNTKTHFYTFICSFITSLQIHSLICESIFTVIAVCMWVHNTKCTKYWWLFVRADVVEWEVKVGAQVLLEQSNKSFSVNVIYKPVWENPEINHKTLTLNMFSSTYTQAAGKM